MNDLKVTEPYVKKGHPFTTDACRENLYTRAQVAELMLGTSAAVTEAKDAALYRSLTRIVLAVQGHRIDWKFGEGSLDAAIEAAALSQGASDADFW